MRVLAFPHVGRRRAQLVAERHLCVLARAPTLAYAILFAADLERSIRFYRDVLGRHAPPEPAPWPQGEVAFFVEGTPARCRRHDPPAPTDRPWGERTLHVADPDGNVIELTRPKRPSPP